FGIFDTSLSLELFNGKTFDALMKLMFKDEFAWLILNKERGAFPVYLPQHWVHVHWKRNNRNKTVNVYYVDSFGVSGPHQRYMQKIRQFFESFYQSKYIHQDYKGYKVHIST